MSHTSNEHRSPTRLEAAVEGVGFPVASRNPTESGGARQSRARQALLDHDPVELIILGMLDPAALEPFDDFRLGERVYPVAPMVTENMLIAAGTRSTSSRSPQQPDRATPCLVDSATTEIA